MGRHVRRLLLWLLALVALVGISLTPLWSGLQQITQPWLVPLVNFSQGVGEWFKNVWQLPSLKKENEILQHEVAELMARQAASSAVYKENEELRGLLALPSVAGFERLSVEVVGQQIDETGTSYIINRGQADGLYPGLAAVAGLPRAEAASAGLVLVGTITQVGARVANLRLITASASEVLAMLAQNPRAQSLAVGEYNLAIRLKYLDIDQSVSVGDAVITSNLSANIPPGLLIGTVTTVERAADQLFQAAIVSPPVPLEQFRFLYILRPLDHPPA